MNRTELVERLSAIRGATIVTIETCTVPTMRKTGNPYAGNCVKISRVNGMIGWSYANSVNNQREREGGTADFEVKERKWGKRIASTPFVVHEGRYYLELKVEHALEHWYETVTGERINVDHIRPFLPAKKTTTAEAQGVEREIILRDYALDNITAITFQGERHGVDGTATAPADAAAA
jgi:hypothetical protein